MSPPDVYWLEFIRWGGGGGGAGGRGGRWGIGFGLVGVWGPITSLTSDVLLE